MSSQLLSVSRVLSFDELDHHRETWRQMTANMPLRSPEWLASWWEQYRSPRDELHLLAVQDDHQKLIGLAPLFARTVGRQKTIRLLGSGEVCTDHMTWLAEEGRAIDVGEAVARYLLESAQSWNRLQWEAIDMGDAALTTTCAQLQKHGCLIHNTAAPSCWTISVPTTWDDYLAQLSKAHRKRCRRLQRQFFDTGRVRTREVTNLSEFDGGWEILLRLHAARWGNERQPQGVFGNARFQAFHEYVARQLLQRQQLRLAWLECDGRPIAVEHQFVDQQTIYAYQSGIDPAAAQLQPGNLSMLATLQYAIDRGLKSIDLLRGDEPYKAHWRAASRPCQDVRIWPGRFAGRVEHTIWGARQAAADWIRSKASKA